LGEKEDDVCNSFSVPVPENRRYRKKTMAHAVAFSERKDPSEEMAFSLKLEK